MGFWKNVKEITDFRSITRKELASSSGVPKYTIDKGIERDSDVTAIVAIKISRTLNIPLETLLNIEIEDRQKTKEENKNLWLLEKYSKIIEALEKMPKETQDKFTSLALDFSRSIY